MIARPTETEYAPYYSGYVSLVPESDVIGVLESQPAELRRYRSAVTAARETFRYAPDKWSIRELVAHLADAERVFGYRAFCISRGEKSPLPGFDEKEYVTGSDAAERGLEELTQEFAAVRDANLACLRRLDRAQWERQGVANGSAVTVRALAFILGGHVRHHLGVLRSRYGVSAAT